MRIVLTRERDRRLPRSAPTGRRRALRSPRWTAAPAT